MNTMSTSIIDMLNVVGDAPITFREYHDKARNYFPMNLYRYPWKPQDKTESNPERQEEKTAKRDEDKPMIIVLVGESGSGKSAITKHLVKNHGFKTVASYTTRPQREGEVNGVDYNFVGETKFNEMKEQGLFAETATYNGWNYGSLTWGYVGEKGDKIAILTPHGLRQVKENKDIDIISFHINVPRRDRLIKILQRGDDIEECYRRSLSDVGQFDGIGDDVDYVIDNPGYAKSVNEITYEIYKCLYEKLTKKVRWSAEKRVDADDGRITE